MPDDVSLAVIRNVPALDIGGMTDALVRAEAAEQVIAIERQLDLIEQHMRDSGIYTFDQVREINELRMRARWKLGKLLAGMARKRGPRQNSSDDQNNWLGFLHEHRLDKDIAHRAQIIGALPEEQLEKALAEAHREQSLSTFAGLLQRARAYWQKGNREQRHQTIAQNAADEALTGTFSLLYGDPPWSFETHSELGKERSPDRHYPTLSVDEIADFRIGDRPIREIANNPAVLFLWCTSSNLHHGLDVLNAWGFTYKSSAVWVKDKIGTGYIFRNKHEVLLYGTRGEMPAPLHQPSSAFEYPRGRHSEKPPEIRAAIEMMFPHFAAATRLELFARATLQGWTCHGYEAGIN